MINIFALSIIVMDDALGIVKHGLEQRLGDSPNAKSAVGWRDILKRIAGACSDLPWIAGLARLARRPAFRPNREVVRFAP
jgi:hypothetical protein